MKNAMTSFAGVTAFALATCLHGQSDIEKNLASQGRLPHGNGIAAAFHADTGIGSHASVLFADDFEDGEVRRWDETRNDGGNVLSLESPGKDRAAPLGARVLKVTSTLGENTGGGYTKWFEPADAVFIRFYVKFDKDCNYVHHFCTLRANRGLNGKERWSGFGGAGLKPEGGERFSTALEPWGNWARWPAPGRWNFYSYWHEMTASPDGKYWGNSFKPDTQTDILKDRWICAEFMLKHNTPGMPDGEQVYWIDGELRGHWAGINWRKEAGLRANALTLESYVTDRWTRQKNNTVFFDNVVIASEYIGPAGR